MASFKEIQPGNYLNTKPGAIKARKRYLDTDPNPEDFFREKRRPGEALHNRDDDAVLSYAKGGKVVDYKHSFKRGRKF